MLQGPQGAQGGVGEKGPRGPAGEVGAEGGKGRDGRAGPQVSRLPLFTECHLLRKTKKLLTFLEKKKKNSLKVSCFINCDHERMTFLFITKIVQ